MSGNGLAFDTIKVRGGYQPADHNYAVQVPIYQTASYELGDTARAERLLGFEEHGFLYSRVTNPTVAALEQRVAALDGASAAIAVGSGMAAISYTLLNVTNGSGRILTAPQLYGGTVDALAKILPTFGVGVDHASDVTDPATFAAAIRGDTRAIFIESITNPNAVVADVEGIAEVAHAHGIPLIVDNTLATPYLFRPFDHGADLVVYSATKGLSGNGSTIAGLILESGRFDWANGRFPQFTEPVYVLRDRRTGAERSFVEAAPDFPFTLRARFNYLAYLGAALGPQDAYLVLLGLETLSERVAKQVASGEKIVRFLQQHPDVVQVNHPSAAGSGSAELAARYLPRGAGTVLSFTVRGTADHAHRVIDATTLFSYQANVGDARSLIINSARTTHGELRPEELATAGIAAETIRLSVGLEDPDDLIADLDQAIQKGLAG
jgi:O-acetylhomoserine (thiol)-lyase